MVLYFSATGNTEYVARELARQLNDECLDLLPRIKAGDHSPIHSERPFVICAPIYVCEMPRFLSKYLKQQPFTGSKEVYCAFTSGGYCGVAGRLAKSLFRKKGMTYRGHAEITMPRNYVANDSYPMLPPDQVEERIRSAKEQIDRAAASIRAGEKPQSRHIFLFESIITVPFNPVWCKYKLTAKDFYTTDTCVGCGKCAKLCPLNNIAIKDGKPVWGNNCTHCMACIANCPTEAIEYGTLSQDKERYTFEKYRYVVKDTSSTET